MRIVQQKVRVTKLFTEVYNISIGTKFKSLLMTPGVTSEQVLSHIRYGMGSRWVDSDNGKDVQQSMVSTPITEISIRFQYNDGTEKELTVWDSLAGFHQAEYEEAKKIGTNIDKIIERNQYAEQYT